MGRECGHSDEQEYVFLFPKHEFSDILPSVFHYLGFILLVSSILVLQTNTTASSPDALNMEPT